MTGHSLYTVYTAVRSKS